MNGKFSDSASHTRAGDVCRRDCAADPVAAGRRCTTRRLATAWINPFMPMCALTTFTTASIAAFLLGALT
ncbi:hypothetical protein ACUXIW_004222 [Ralstonia pickettii]|jgi:hypothetical protein